MHELKKLTVEIEKQIKEQNYVHMIIDKETVDKMRKSMRSDHEKAIAGVGGVDKKIKNFGVKNYTLKEDVNWIRQYVNRNVVGHKLKFFTGSDEIHIVSNVD